MPVRASIEPLTWENAFFGVNSAIVRISPDAALLTPDALAPWSRVQAKIAASNTGELDALQQLGFSLVEGEVDLALPVNNVSDSGAVVAQETDIPALRQLAIATQFATTHCRLHIVEFGSHHRRCVKWNHVITCITSTRCFLHSHHFVCIVLARRCCPFGSPPAKLFYREHTPSLAPFASAQHLHLVQPAGQFAHLSH